MPAPPASERDYLVIFEEPDPYGLPSDDTLVLDVDSPRAPSHGELDVQQQVDIELTNTTNRTGTIGFVVSCLGALMGVSLMVAFASIYPDDWYNSRGFIADTDTVRNMLAFSIATVVLMISGLALTFYGRRIKARGNLSAMRIVEKQATSRLALER